jgi:hypothetical protein
MGHAFALHALAETSLAQQVDGSLLEHACANALLDVLTRMLFEHYGLDTRA